VIAEYHDLSGRISKGCESSVYDLRNDVDAEIRSHNVTTPAKGDMVAQFWSDWFEFLSASLRTHSPFSEVPYRARPCSRI
jgi:hypothetical protein